MKTKSVEPENRVIESEMRSCGLRVATSLRCMSEMAEIFLRMISF
jgi:hypothetical protein